MDIKTLSCIFNVSLIFVSYLPSLFAQSVEPGSIGGNLTADGRPLAGVRVACILTTEGNEKLSQAPTLSQSVSDKEGKYLCEGLKKGNYRVIPSDLTLAIANEIDNLGRRKLVRIDAGEQVTQIDFNLASGGIISGKITNNQNHPIIGQPIQLLPVSKGDWVSESVLQNRLMFLTDDLGNYRLYGLPKGKYKVCIGSSGYGLHADSALNYPNTCYSKNSGDALSPIAVELGQEVTDINIKLPSPVPTHTVRGKVILASSGQPLMGIKCVLSDKNFFQDFKTSVTNEEGEFTFTNLSSEAYRVRLLADELHNYYAEKTNIAVDDSDIEVTIPAKLGSTIKGHIFVEGRQSDFNGISLICNYGELGQTATTSISPDGAFTLKGILPGKATIFLQGPGVQSIRLKAIERENTALPFPFFVGANEELNLSLYFQTGGGSVVGSLKIVSEGSTPSFTRLQATLLPMGGVLKGAYSTSPDSRGRFSFDGLPSGEYRVQSSLVVSGQVIRSEGQVITITDSKSITVDLVINIPRK